MKSIWSILIVAIMLLSFSQEANAHWRGGFYHGGYYRGGWGPYYGYGYRPFIPPVPVPAPYYRRPYVAVPPPVVPGRWIAPHWRRGPYGDQWVRGHWAR